MMNDQLQQRRAKKPNDVSLWDLVANNLIPDRNINLNGKVDDLTYQNALREYNQNFNNNNVRRTRIANINRLTRRRRDLSEENENNFDNLTNDRFQTNNQIIRPSSVRYNNYLNNQNSNNQINRASTASHINQLNNQNSGNQINRPSTASHINQLRLLKEAINENRQLQERNCCICLTKPVTHVFIPCYHLCTCINCSSKINKCPKCRKY